MTVTMKQAVWTGSISFGLVNIPVKLYPATEPKDVRFHLYDRRSGKRVRYERVARADEAAIFVPEPREDEPIAPLQRGPASREDTRLSPPLDIETTVDDRVSAPDIVRGFQLPTGDLVTVSDEELAEVAPARSRTIDIEEFVELSQIDPVFFDKTYYLAPARVAGAEKPYALLLRAMREARMVAIGRFVLRTRPHLVAVRPLDRALALETLFFGDEVRSPEEVGGRLPSAAVSERELKTALQLVRALSTEWVPEKHGDAYREELLALLRGKAPAVPAEAGEVAAPVSVDDLMAALKASVDAAKQKAPRERRSADAARARRAR